MEFQIFSKILKTLALISARKHLILVLRVFPLNTELNGTEVDKQTRQTFDPLLFDIFKASDDEFKINR